jgi:hypothetical protein
VIWAYAICDHPDVPLPRRRGLAHAPLEGIRAGELLAVVSQHTQAPGDPALDALWAHERVVERLMADRSVLPLRFGTKLPDAEAVRATLAARQDEFVSVLDQVRGRVELGVRAMTSRSNGAPAAVVAPRAPVAVTRSGREYLLEKLAHGHRSEREAAALHEPLSALSVATRRGRVQSDDELLRAAYLVERANIGRFRAAVQRLQQQHADVALLCTGPWPPYSFVGGREPAVTAIGEVPA